MGGRFVRLFGVWATVGSLLFTMAPVAVATEKPTVPPGVAGPPKSAVDSAVKDARDSATRAVPNTDPVDPKKPEKPKPGSQ